MDEQVYTYDYFCHMESPNQVITIDKVVLIGYTIKLVL